MRTYTSIHTQAYILTDTDTHTHLHQHQIIILIHVCNPVFYSISTLTGELSGGEEGQPENATDAAAASVPPPSPPKRKKKKKADTATIDIEVCIE
jgi:hypothetical protein